MTSDENYTTVDTDKNKSKAETDQNHNYVESQSFGLENTPYPSYTNEWGEFL